MMKPRALLALAAFAVANPSPAHALDCRKASSPVEQLISTTAELKQADEAMSAAYFKLLRATTDPDFHAALIRSQRRWSEIRSHGVDRFGAAADVERTDDRQVLLEVTRDRLARLQAAEPIRTMEQQRRLAAQDGGGPFAGYESSCFFEPPPYGGWRYVCVGSAHRQHDARICSVATEWASGRVNELRLLSVLRNGEPKPVASCSIGLDDTNARCPEPDDAAAIKAAAHWNTNPRPSDDRHEAPTKAHDLWKYDPDVDMSVVDRPWMHDRLLAPTFPP
jgi:uncharacterized protein YecT (DUF1311 family)